MNSKREKIMDKKIRIGFESLPEEYVFGVNELAAEEGFETVVPSDGDCDAKVCVEKTDKKELSLTLSSGKALIRSPEPSAFFRALGRLISALKAGESEFCVNEPILFDSIGPMFDVSQGNAVINVRTVKKIIRKMALMGLNMLMLYCEDSYDVEEEPYFGYMRSRYSYGDMKELDGYAARFGIEMIPCIQTLAHLQSVLRWKEYKPIADDPDTLLVGEEKTYEFIRRVIESASAPFTSRRIHIGMDEAMMLGQGNYLKKHGLKKRSEILMEHLKRVVAITGELGLEPMMWSDMFMRVLNEKSDYYSNEAIPDELKSAVPEGLRLVYWDYYHDKSDFYGGFIDRHRVFGEPVFAGGIWTWLGFGPNYLKTIKNTDAALEACKTKGVKEVIATVWGDNGTECSVVATLPLLQLFAEHRFARVVDKEAVKRRFDALFGSDFDAFMLLQKIDEVPGVPEGNERDFNSSKPLLWQDVLAGMCDLNFSGIELDAHYENLCKTLEEAKTKAGFGSFFDVYIELCRTLSVKAEAGIRLRKAYLDGDKKTLAEFADFILPDLIARVGKLREAHMKHWFEIYKPLGWDIFDMRYGSLLIRLDSAVREIKAYLSGELETISELDEKRLPYNSEEKFVHYANYYGKLVSAGRIDPRPHYPHFLG